MNLIEIKNLKKSFGEKEVLKNVSISLKEGKVYVLLGRNGAGKTTFINILLNIIQKDSGMISTNLDVKKNVGVVFQEDYFPKDISLNNLIKLQASFFKVKININNKLKEMSLEKEINQRAITLSGGQKRKLSFLLSLIHEPTFLILDEPTAGMDYDSIDKFVNKIEQLKQQGKTILLITHDLYQIESFADYILFLNEGVLEENIAINQMLQEEVYEFPKEIIKSVNNIDTIFYIDDKKIIINKSNAAQVIKQNNIQNPEEFKRYKQVKDIFKRISFVEGEKK